jgi:tetratricopeptide (TPR) repeat protein
LKGKNVGGQIEALEQLVASHPKHEYWVTLCRVVLTRRGFAPRLRLDLDRLSVAAGVFDAPAQYVEAAERALEAGFPGDAKAFLDKGYAAGVLGQGAGADRQKRLSDTAKHQAGEDERGLAQQAKEADAAKTGIPFEKLGEAYASYGRFADASTAIERGIAKGGLDHPGDAKLHLGVAYLNASRTADAMQTLNVLKSDDGSADLAQLWLTWSALR